MKKEYIKPQTEVELLRSGEYMLDISVAGDKDGEWESDAKDREPDQSWDEI